VSTETNHVTGQEAADIIADHFIRGRNKWANATRVVDASHVSDENGEGLVVSYIVVVADTRSELNARMDELRAAHEKRGANVSDARDDLAAPCAEDAGQDG
jgi:hypothetical protein